MKSSEILVGAAKLIDERGWFHPDEQKDPRQLGRAFCPVTAVVELCGYRELTFALRYIRLAIGGASIVEWNDAPGRTKQEVLSMMADAAGRAAAEETKTAHSIG